MMQSSPDTNQPETRSADRLGSTINELAALVSSMGTGDRADLRKGDHEDPGSPAFWKVVVSQLVPRGFLDLDSVNSPRLSRWVVILAALAELEGLHNPKIRLGRALAEAGFSELRLTRLLRAEGSQLLDSIRQMIRFLASKGANVDVADVARLVLFDGPRIRRVIASHYYAAHDL